MANGHGGAQIGAGGKKKPLADTVLEGNPGRRKLTIIDLDNVPDLTGQDLYALEIYDKTWLWLKKRGCVHLVNPLLIEHYGLEMPGSNHPVPQGNHEVKTARQSQ